MHKDGVKHTMTGAFGTFEVTAQAGNYASIKWTFTGLYDAESTTRTRRRSSRPSFPPRSSSPA